MKKKDITDLVEFGDIDSESMPLIRCACGQKFPLWEVILGVYPDMPTECPNCGRKLYFDFSVKVFEISE